MEAWSPFPHALPYMLFHLAISELYPFIINRRSSKQNVSLNSVDCSSKSIEPKEGVMGTSDL